MSPATVGSRLAARSARAVAIDAGVFDGMVVAGRESYAAPHDGRATSEQVRQLLLRWSAALATAETYQLEGFDAVISDHVPGPRLEDFLDLVSPEPVHLVVLGAPDDPAMRETPRGACASTHRALH